VNIAEILLRRSTEMGDAPAILDVHRGNDRSFSFSELARATAAIAEQFRSAGLKQGDGVLLLHPVAAELYLALIALFRLGCVGIFLDPSAGREHIERCCATFPPAGFFGSTKAQLLRWTSPALRRIPQSFAITAFPGARRIDPDTNASGAAEIVPVDGDAPALVTFTSGGTGEPKAALRTHDFLLAQHRALEESLAMEPGARDLTTLPIFVLANLGSGVTSMLPDADLRFPRQVKAPPVISQIKRHGITTTAMSPAFAQRIVDECGRTNTTIGETRRVFLGGAPVFPGILRQTKRCFPNASVTAVYGSTEAEPMAEVRLEEIAGTDFQSMAEGKGLLAGAPVRAIQLRVIRDQWGTALPPMNGTQFESLHERPEHAGEIVVSGAHVLPGYLHGEGDAETKFTVDGTRWHRTGDLGYCDSHGRLWLLGRCAAKLSDARGVQYPFAVECAVRERFEVENAALVSVRGLRVLAIESKTKLPANEILDALSWAQLDRVIFVDHLPVDKRHNAKIDYVELARYLSTFDFDH
jgi:olefin beta-lactone synthetase